MGDVHAYYLRDLGLLLREAAFDAKSGRRWPWGRRRSSWEDGRAYAYYEVISLMQDQADTYELPYDDIGLDGVDAFRDLWL